MPVRTGTLSLAAERVTAIFEDLFADIERMRARLVDLFAEGPLDSLAAVAAIEPDVKALLGKGTALGGGYVAARDALLDRSLYLAWWQGEGQTLLGESEEPVSGAPFDYTRREWFRVPEQTGGRHITGPYVDYVCTDEYVLTCTAAVVSRERMLGVVGADVLAETVEGLLLPVMRDVGATLVGVHGRTIVSGDHRCAPGVLLDLSSVRERVDCGDLPLAIVVPETPLA